MSALAVAVGLGVVVALAASCRPSAAGGSPTASMTAASPAPAARPGVLRYVALGDSYTIGTSVLSAERWPDQLVAAIGPEPPTLDLVANLAVNGYTSGDIVARQLPALDEARPDFVSLLVGVNDVVQGVPAERFRDNAATIVDDLLGRLPAERILVVATPDYTVTPQGAEYGDPTAQAAGIRENNAILETLATERGIAWVDIHDLSLRAAADRALVASDGLHPSGAQYALWVGRILPVVERLIQG